MGTEVAVRRGVGTVVLDVRRGDGPKACFNYTMASVATSDRLINDHPDMRRQCGACDRRGAGCAARPSPSWPRRGRRKPFPPEEAALITDLIRRDLPYYDAGISPGLSSKG